jgi:hypothetical protein
LPSLFGFERGAACHDSGSRMLCSNDRPDSRQGSPAARAFRTLSTPVASARTIPSTYRTSSESPREYPAQSVHSRQCGGRSGIGIGIPPNVNDRPFKQNGRSGLEERLQDHQPDSCRQIYCPEFLARHAAADHIVCNIPAKEFVDALRIQLGPEVANLPATNRQLPSPTDYLGGPALSAPLGMLASALAAAPPNLVAGLDHLRFRATRNAR